MISGEVLTKIMENESVTLRCCGVGKQPLMI
jgi:hypothetical protein